MPRRPVIAGAFAVFVVLMAPPTVGQTVSLCPPSPDTSPDGGAVRIRAVASALIPSVYLKLDATTVRRKRRRAALSAPDGPRDGLGRWRVDADSGLEWEIGVSWNPIRLLRRSRDARRLRTARPRRPMTRRAADCPLSPEDRRPVEGSFEERLERAAARQKRHSLDKLLD